MQYVKGGLLELADQGQFDVIVHGCNCFHIFGAGIALQVLRKWPAAYLEDLKTARGGRLKLGRFSTITQPTSAGKMLTLVNAYTQFDLMGSGGIPVVDYAAIREVFNRIRERYGKQGLKFGIPQIGAGLAGGDWKAIEPVIDKAMAGEDITCVLFGQ